MEVTILTPVTKRTVTVAWVEANTPTGNYIIQLGHAPMILILSPNKDLIFHLPNGKQEIINVKDGLLEVTRTTTTAILDQ